MSDSHRLGWEQLSPKVRQWAQLRLGSPMMSHQPHGAGYSPGAVERLVGSDGNQLFLKAASEQLNAVTVTRYRRAIEVLRQMPVWVPTPGLVDSYDHDGWVALLVEPGQGHHPNLPWGPEQLDQVLCALQELAARATPCPLPHLPSIADAIGPDFAGWSRLQLDPPAEMPQWALHRMGEFADRSRAALLACRGDTLCHLDVRSDNVLLDERGQVMLLGWTQACRAACWVDAGLLMLQVISDGPQHAGDWIARVAADGGVPLHDVHNLLIAMTGYFLDSAGRVPPPGMPTLRAFQRRTGQALLRWMATLD